MLLRTLVMIYSIGCAAYFGSIRSICTFLVVPILWIAWARYLNRLSSTRVEFQWSACALLLMWFVPLATWCAYVGILASPEPWGVFDTRASPLGRSPCCSSIDVAGASNCVRDGARVPYNPLGYYVYGKDAPLTINSPAVTMCPVGRWADSNGVAPVGHNALDNGDVGAACVSGQPCDFLASNSPEDYSNLGNGLKDGWFIAAVVSPLSLCPGVALTPNSAGIVGRGTEICSRCQHPRPAHCADSSKSQMFCFMCPWGHFGSEPILSYRDVRFTFDLVIGQGLFMLISTALAIPKCGKSYPSRYGPLF